MADTFATVTQPFGARADQRFALTWRLAEEWEAAHGSLFHAFDLMQARREATAAQVRDLIRLGLQGAGMGPTDVLVAIARHVEARPLAESFPIAMAIAGGTSEVTRNQIAERILGMPRDPLIK